VGLQFCHSDLLLTTQAFSTRIGVLHITFKAVKRIQSSLPGPPMGHALNFEVYCSVCKNEIFKYFGLSGW